MRGLFLHIKHGSFPLAPGTGAFSAFHRRGVIWIFCSGAGFFLELHLAMDKRRKILASSESSSLASSFYMLLIFSVKYLSKIAIRGSMRAVQTM